MKKISVSYAYYAAALCAVVCGFALPVYKAWGLLLAAAFCIAVFFVFKAVFCEVKIKNDITFTKTGVTEADAILREGKNFITRLEALKTLINDEKINGQITALSAVAGDIFRFVEKNPEQARQIADFADYYPPTVLKLLDTYAELYGKGNIDSSGNISDAVNRIAAVMETIGAAFYKQLDTLYQSKSMDVKADIAVLETLMKREGLK